MLNIFINNLDNGAECTACNFADNTKQQELSDTLEGHAVIQRHLDSLEKWADKYTMKFNQEKCEVLHRGRNNLIYQFMLEGEHLEISFALGFLVNTCRTWASNTSLHQERGKVSSSELGKGLSEVWCRWSFPFNQCWWGHTWNALSSSGLPSTKEPWTYWSESNKEPQIWFRNWSVSPMSRDCSAQRREGSGGSYQYLWLSGRVKKTLLSSVQWQDQRQGPQTETQEVASEHQDIFSL